VQRSDEWKLRYSHKRVQLHRGIAFHIKDA
jgi:hypothetical protein